MTNIPTNLINFSCSSLLGIVQLTKVEGGLEGVFVPDGDIKAAKRKISWLADVPENIPVVLSEFDNLIIKEKLEEDDKLRISSIQIPRPRRK